MTSSTNILSLFLVQANVKHTRKFTNQFFNEHPHKYNLFGLSSMLSDYGIENAGLKITNKNDIHLIDSPFIAHLGNDFAIVEKKTKSEIQFIQTDKRIRIPLDEFKKVWTGYVIIAEPDKLSQEPEYKKHKLNELFLNAQKIVVFFFIALLFILGFIFNNSFINAGKIFSLILNLVGVYIGYLLILKQLNIHSDYADKLCSLFKHSDCNNILESDASKLFGFLGWSEVGFGYFVSNIVILSFFSSLIPIMAIINIFGLPYTLWSVWYQKLKAKQWCPLCLVVMILLWGVFIINLTFGYIEFSSITFFSLFLTGAMYIVFILSTNILVPIIRKSMNMDNIRYEINSIKADEEVFRTLLMKQPYFDVTKATSSLLFGNCESDNLITVFSNPHCNPCASMHKRMNDLLNRNKDICIQYIFSSFHKDLDISNKYLIGVYQQKNGERKQLFNKWFEHGSYNKEEFFKKLPVEINNTSVESEFEMHQKWKEKSGLNATPTILVNGYKMPDNYKLEDLRFMSNI